MRLSDERYEEIKAEVIDLFIRYDVRCIPISGFELAMKMNIILAPYSSLSEEQRNAALEISSDGFYFEPGDGTEKIYYNDEVGYERCNMTILHEIGHAVLGHHDGMDQDEAESEAAFFAKYAAAPPPLIHQICPNRPEDIEVGCKHERVAFMKGYNAMLEAIEPTAVICFGVPFPEMDGNIIAVDYLSSRKVVRYGR